MVRVAGNNRDARLGNRLDELSGNRVFPFSAEERPRRHLEGLSVAEWQQRFLFFLRNFGWPSPHDANAVQRERRLGICLGGRIEIDADDRRIRSCDEFDRFTNLDGIGWTGRPEENGALIVLLPNRNQDNFVRLARPIRAQIRSRAYFSKPSSQLTHSSNITSKVTPTTTGSAHVSQK